jgi:energy-coupling factor transporter ATP-binding protein EcfA2
VLDEPTALLDPEGTRLVGDAVRRLAEAGTALLLTEHKTDLLADVCDRAVVIDGGRLVADGPTDTILGDPDLEARGVDPPTSVRLVRALVRRGLDPSVVAT